MLAPINIIDVLAAATPIVASVASIVTSNKKPVEDKNKTEDINTDKKDTQPPNINITINNHFYTIPKQEDIIVAAQKNEEQIVDSIISSGNRYLL